MHGLFSLPNCSLLSISSPSRPPSMGTFSNMTSPASGLHISLWGVRAVLCMIVASHKWCWATVSILFPCSSLYTVWALSAGTTHSGSLPATHVRCHVQLPCGSCNVPVAVTLKPVFSILQSEQRQEKNADPLRYPCESYSSIPGARSTCTQKLCSSSQNGWPYPHSNQLSLDQMSGHIRGCDLGGGAD